MSDLQQETEERNERANEFQRIKEQSNNLRQWFVSISSGANNNKIIYPWEECPFECTLSPQQLARVIVQYWQEYVEGGYSFEKYVNETRRRGGNLNHPFCEVLAANDRYEILNTESCEIRKKFIKTYSGDEFEDANDPELLEVIPGILYEGVTLLSAAPKTGKSWFVLDLAHEVLTGGQFLGRQIKAPGSVLYIDAENDRRVLRSRTQKMKISFRRLPITFVDNTMGVPTVDNGLLDGANEWYNEEISKGRQPRLIVIDTLIRVQGQAPTRANAYQADSKTMQPFKNFALQHPGVCILLVHHVNKAGAFCDDREDPFASISGSNGVRGTTDTNIIIRGSKDDPQKKLYTEGRFEQDLQLVIEFRGREDCKWHVVGNLEDVIKERALDSWIKDPVRNYVLKALEDVSSFRTKATDLLEAINADFPYDDTPLNARLLGQHITAHKKDFLRDGVSASKGGKGGSIWTFKKESHKDFQGESASFILTDEPIPEFEK